MRQSMARPRHRRVATGVVRRLLRAVRNDERRIRIPVAKQDPRRCKKLFLSLQFSSHLIAQLDAAGTLVIQFIAVAHHGEQTVKVVGCFRRIPQSDRMPFDMIGVKHGGGCPSLDHGSQLPTQIDGIADSGIHTQAPGRRELVYRIAGHENPTAGVTVGDQGMGCPRLQLDDLDVDIAAHQPTYRFDRVDVGPLLALVENLVVGPQDSRIPIQQKAAMRFVQREIYVAVAKAVCLHHPRRAKVDGDETCQSAATGHVYAEPGANC
jgi:hypothetical protein